MGRIWTAMLVTVALLFVASTATAGENIRECRKITRQIARYEETVEMARERENPLWEKATLNHLQRLSDRRRRLCPEMVAEMEKGKARRVMEESAALMKTAGKVALRVFTFGAYPPF